MLHFLYAIKDEPININVLDWTIYINLWIANNKANAATVFSPPDRLDIGWNRLPGATQL